RRVGDLRGDQLDGTDGVIVSGDDVVNLVGITVGVRDRDNWDAKLAGFGDGNVLFTGVHDVDRTREPLHLRHATKEALEPLVLLFQLRDRLLAPGEATVIAGRAKAVETVDLAPHHGEVGQHAAHPAVVDKGHARAASLQFDRFLGLFLGADEEHQAATADDLLDPAGGVVE